MGESQEQALQQRRGSRHRGDGPEERGSPTSNSDAGAETELLAAATGVGRRNPHRATDLCRRGSSLTSLSAGGGAAGRGDSEAAAPGPRYHLVSPLAAAGAHGAAVDGRLSSTSNTTLSIDRDSSESGSSRHSPKNSFSGDEGGALPKRRAGPDAAAAVRPVSVAGAGAAGGGEAGGPRWKTRVQGGVGVGLGAAAMAQQHQLDNLALPVSTAAGTDGPAYVSTARGRWVQRPRNPALVGAAVPSPVVWRRGPTTEEACRRSSETCVLLPPAEDSGSGLSQEAAEEAAGNGQLKMQGAAENLDAAECPAGAEEGAAAEEAAAAKRAAEAEGFAAAPEAVPAAAALELAVAAPGKSAAAAPGEGDETAEDVSDLLSSQDSVQTSRLLSKRSAWSRRSTTGVARDSNPDGEGARACLKAFTAEVETEEEEEVAQAAATAGVGQTSSAAAAAEDADESAMSDKGSRAKRILPALVNGLLASCCCCVTSQLWQDNRWLPERWRRRRGCRCVLQVLLLLLLLLLLFLPIFFSLLMPHIIASYVKGGGVKVLSTAMRKQRPDGFEAVVTVQFLTYVPLHVEVADTHVDVFTQDQRVGRTAISTFTLDRNSKQVTFASDFLVEDLSAWENFLRELFTRGSSEWRMQGSCTVKFLGLTYRNIPFNKVLDIEGPTLSASDDGETPFVVKQIDMSSSTPRAIVARVSVEYNNSSTSSVESIGIVKFAMLYNGYPVGILTSVGPIGMQLGSNAYTFIASMSHQDVIQLLRAPAAAAAVAAANARSGASSTAGGAGPRRLAATPPLPHRLLEAGNGDGGSASNPARNAFSRPDSSGSHSSGMTAEVLPAGASGPVPGGGATPANGEGKSSRSSGAAAGGAGVIERSLGSHSSEDDGEALSDTSPEDSAGKEKFLQALSQLTNAALSGDTTAKVVCVGIDSSERLFAGGLRALLMESALQGLFDDNEGENEAEAGERKAGIKATERKKTKRKGERSSPFFKGMEFHKFSLAPPADAEAPPDDADVTAEVVVRFLNPLGTAHPFTIEKVEVQAVLRHRSAEGRVLGHISGEMLPRGPPQPVASLDAPFVRIPPAGDSRAGDAAGGRGNAAGKRGRGRQRGGGNAGATGDPDAARRPRREKKYNYPDLAEARKEEEVPTDLSPEEWNSRTAYFADDEAMRLAAVPDPWPAHADDSDVDAGGEEEDAWTLTPPGSLPGGVPDEAAASARQGGQALQDNEDGKDQEQRGGQQSGSAGSTAATQQESGAPGAQQRDGLVNVSPEEEEEEGQKRLLQPSPSSQPNQALQQKQQQQQQPQKRSAAEAVDGGTVRRLAAWREEGEERAKQRGKTSSKLPHASVMDLTFTMRGRLHVLDGGAAFAEFMREMASQEKVGIAFTKTHARLSVETGIGKLQLNDVQLDGEEQLDGMASMRNVTVESFDVIGEVDGGRTWLLETRVLFPSAAPTSVYIGDLGFALAFDGVRLGWMAGRNVRIEEGGNAMQFVGMLQPPPEAAEIVSRFFSAALAPAEDDDEEDQKEEEQGAGGADSEREDSEETDGTLKERDKVGDETEELLFQRAPQGDTLGKLEGGAEAEATGSGGDGEVGERRTHEEEGEAAGEWRGSSSSRKGTGLSRKRGQKRPQKPRPIMEVVVTSEAIERVNDTLEAAAAQEGRIARYVAMLLHPHDGEEEEEEGWRAIPWISKGLEDMQLLVPCPTIGSASDMIQRINMREMRLDLTSNAAKEEGKTGTSAAPALPQESRGRLHVGEEVAFAGVVELIVSNPLGSRLIPRIEGVEMDVLLLAALPAEEAAVVPTPSGRMQPVAGFGHRDGAAAAAAADRPLSGEEDAAATGPAAAVAADRRAAAAGDGAAAPALLHKVPVGRMAAVLSGVTVTPLTTAAARAMMAAAAAEERLPASRTSSVSPSQAETKTEREPEGPAGLGNSDAVSSSPGDSQLLTSVDGTGRRDDAASSTPGGEAGSAATAAAGHVDDSPAASGWPRTGGPQQQGETDAAAFVGDEEEEEPGAMLLLRVPLSASLQLIGDGENFTDFVVAVFQAESVPVTFRGEAACRMRTGFGEINVKGIDVSATLPVKGLQGLQGSTVTSLTIEGTGLIDDYVRRKRSAAADGQTEPPAADADALTPATLPATSSPNAEAGAAGGAFARGLAAAVADAVAAAVLSGTATASVATQAADRRQLSAVSASGAPEDSTPRASAAGASTAAATPPPPAASPAAVATLDAGGGTARPTLQKATAMAAADGAAARRAAWAAPGGQRGTRSPEGSRGVPGTPAEPTGRAAAAREPSRGMQVDRDSSSDSDVDDHLLGEESADTFFSGAAEEEETGEEAAAARKTAAAAARVREQGLLLSLEVEMRNNGDAAVALGCIDVDLFHQGVRVGRMSTNSCDASLNPGLNKLAFCGGIILSPETETAVSSLFSRSVRDENLDVQTRTASSFAPTAAGGGGAAGESGGVPQERPRWLTRAMDRVQLMPRIPPFKELLPGMNVADLLQDFDLESVVITDIGEDENDEIVSLPSTSGGSSGTSSSFLFDIATDTTTSSVGSEVLSDAWEKYLLHPSARSHAWPSSSRLPDVAARQLLRRQQQLRENSSDSPASNHMARDASTFSSLANAIAAATAARNAPDVEAGETKPGPAAGQHPEEAGDPGQSVPKGRKLSAVRTTVDTSNSPAVVCSPPSSPDEAAARRRPLQGTTRKLPGQPGSPVSRAADLTLSGPQRQLSAVANSSSLFNDAQSSIPSHRSAIAPGHAATVHSSSFRVYDASAGASTSEEEPESRGAAVLRSRSATAVDATPEDDAAACASSVPLLRSVPSTALGTASFGAESTAGERAAGFVSAHKKSLPGDVRPGAGEETAWFNWRSHSGDAGGRAYATRHEKGGGDVFGSSSAPEMSPSSSFSTNSSAPCFAPDASSSSAVGSEGPEASAHVAACGRVLGSRVGSPADSLLTGRRLAGASSYAESAAVRRALASELSGVHECRGPWCTEQQHRRRSEAEEESERSEQGESGEESVPHRLVFSALSHVHAKHPFGQKVVPMRVKAVSFEAVVFSGAAVAAAAAEAAKQQQQQGASEQPRLPPGVAPLGRLVIPLTAVLPAAAPADTAEGRAAGAAAEAPVGAAGERRLGDQGPPSTSDRPTSGERSTDTDTSHRERRTGAAAAVPADETTVLPAEEEDTGGDSSFRAGKQNAAAAATPDGNMDFSFELQRAVLLLEDGGQPLGAAIAAFLKHPDAGFPLFMKGTAGVQVDMGNGLATVSIQGIPVDRFFTLGDKRQPATAATAAEEEDGLASRDEAETAESDVLFNTSLQTFHFDGLHPEGGLRFSAVAQMKNSMPVAIVLPSLLFSLYYKDALLGYVWTRDGLRMQPFPEPTEISLRGQLLHQTEPRNLSRLNELAEAILARSTLGAVSPSAGNAAAGDAAGTAAVPASADRPRVTVRPWLDRELLRRFMEEDWLLSQQARRPAGAGAGPEDAGEAAAEERAWRRPATTPLWLQRALHALEVLAPVESEKLFPTAGFVKQVHMRRVAVRVDGGPLDAIHVDADVLLQLVNPFDGVPRPPARSGASPVHEHRELPSPASAPPAAGDIPTFAIQSLQLGASIGAAGACAADDEAAVSSTAGSAAAAADLDGRSGRRRETGTAALSQSREKSSSSSIRATTCNAAIFGSLRTPVLDFTEDAEQETLRSFSSADSWSPSSPAYFANGRGPGTTTASSSLSSEPASFENFDPSALPFHGRVLAAVDDEATAAAETAPPAGMPPGSLMTAAGERQRPPAPAAQAAAATEPPAHASSTAEADLQPRVPPPTGEKVTGAAPAVDDAFRASGSSAKWPAYQAARPVGEANDRGFSGWGGPVSPEDTARSARTPADMQRHMEEWNERRRLRKQILQAQREQQEEEQLDVAALSKLHQKTKTGLLQQQQQKHYAAEGGYGVHQGSYSLNNLFGLADPSRRALIEGGAGARWGRSSSLFGTATAVRRRGLTCVPLDLYEQQQQTERDEGPDRDRERELQLLLEQLQQERQQLPKAREDAWWQQHEAKMGEVRQELEELQQRRRTLATAREKDVGACMLALPFEGDIEVLDEAAFVNFALQSVTATQPAFPCTAPQRGGGGAAAELKRETGLVRADQAGDSSSAVVGCMGGSSGRANGGVVVDGSAAVVVETPLGTLRVNRVPVQQHLEFVQMQDIVQSAAHGVKMLNFEILNVTFGDAQGVDSISFRANVALGESGDGGSSAPSFAADGETVAEGDGAGPQGRHGELLKTGNDLMAIAERRAETSNRNEGSNSSTQFEVHAGTLTLDLLMEGQAVGAIVAKNIVLGRRNQGSSVSKAAAAATAGSNEEAEDADAPPAVQVEGTLKDVSRHRGTKKSKLLQLMQSAVSGRPLPLLLRSAQKQQVPRPAWLLKIIDSMQVTPSLSGLMSSLALVESMRLTQVKINVLDSRRLGIDAVVKVSANNPLNSSQVEVRLEDFSADVRLFQQVQPEARNNEQQPQERQLQHEKGKKQEEVLLGVLRLAQRAIPKSSTPATTTDGTQLQFQVPLSYEKYGDQLVLEGGGEAFGEYITRVIHSSESLPSGTAAAAKAPAAAGERGEAVEAPDAEEPATAAAMGYVRYEAVVNARLMTTFGPLQIENFPVSAEVNILESLLPSGGEGLIAEKQEPPLQQRKRQEAHEAQQQQHGRRPAAAPSVLKGKGLVNGVTFDVRSLRFDGDSEPAASAAAAPAAAAFLKHVRAASRAAQAERQKKESSEVEAVPQTGVGFSADVALQLPLDVDVSLGTLIFALEVPTAPYAQDSDTASATGSPAAAVDDAGRGSAVARASVQAEREGAAAAVAAARQPWVLSTPGSASSERRLAGADHETATAGTDAFTRKAAAARRAGGEVGEKGTAAAAETSAAAQRRPGRHGGQQHQQEDGFSEVEAETVPLGWLVLPSMAVEAGKQTVLQAHGFLLPPADALPLVSKFFSACVRGEEPVVVVKGVAALLPTAREEEAAAVAARAAAAVAATDGEKDAKTAETAEGTVVWLQRLVQSLRVPAPVPPSMRGFVTDSFADLKISNLSLSAVAPAVLGRDDRVAIGAAVSARIASPLGPQSPLVLHHIAVDVVLHRKKSPGHRSDPFQQQLQQPQAEDQQQLPQTSEPRQQEEREKLRRGVQRFTTADPGDGEPSTGSSRRRLAVPVSGAQGDEAETVGDAESSAAAGGGGEETAAAGGAGEGQRGETESAVDEADLEMVGSLQISSLPFRQTDAMLETEVKEALLMLHDNGDAFAEVALGLLNTRETLSLYVRGTTSVLVDTALGRLHLQGLPLSVPVPVAGMSLFDGNALGALAEGALDKLRVWDIEDDEWSDSSTAAAEAGAAGVATAPTGSGPTGPRTGERDDEEDDEEEKEGSGAFHLATQLNLHNTNDVYAALGDMVFDVTYEKETIAAVVVSNFRMQPGDNELFLEGVVKPQGVAAFSALASAFFVNKQYTLGVRGVGGGEDDAGAASAAGVPAANAAAGRPRPLAHAEEGSGRAAAAAAAGGSNSSSSSFAGSSVRPSEAALLAMRRCGITTRPPRWLRLVLSRVEFAVPISGRGGNEAAGGASGDSSGASGDFSVSKLVREVQVLSVDVDFSGPRDPVIGGDLRVFYDMPHNFQIRHTVLSLTSRVTLIHESRKNGDRLIGSMHVQNVRPSFSGQMPADVRLEQLERRQPERQLRDVREEGEGGVEAPAVVQQQQKAAEDPLQGGQLKKSSLLRKFSQKIKAKRQRSSESAQEPPSPTVSEQSLRPTSVASSSSVSSSSTTSPISLSAPDFAAAEQQQKKKKQTAKERLKRWATFGKRDSGASTSTESAEAEEQPDKPHRKPKWNPLASKKHTAAAAAAEQQPTAASHPPGSPSPLHEASGGREEARVVEEQQRQPQEENASAASSSAWQQAAASSSETETPGGEAGGRGSTKMQRTLESWQQWKEKRRAGKKQKEQSGGSLRRKLAAAYGVVDDDDDEETAGDPDEHETPWRSAAAAAVVKDLPDASGDNSDSRGDTVTRAAAAGAQGASELSPSESNAWSDDAEEGGQNRTSLGSFFSPRDLLSALGLESESSENDFGSPAAGAESPSVTLPPAAAAAARQTPRAATGRATDGGATVGGPEAETAAAERATAGRATVGGAAAERAAAERAAAGGAAVGRAAVGRAAATAQGREATAGGGRSGEQMARRPSGAVSNRGRLDFSMENVTLVVAEGAERAMSEMLTEMVEGKGAMKVRVVGDADLVLRTAVGQLTLRKIPVNLLQQFKCIEGLEGKGEQSLFKMSNFGVDRGLAEALHTSADLQLQMPEAVKQYSVKLGRVTLQLFMPVTKDQRSRLADFQLLHPSAQALVQPHPRLGWIIKIGDIIVDDLKIPSEAERLRALEQDGKELTLKGKAVLLPPPLNIDGEEANIGTPLLMSNYMNGVPSPLFVKGSLQSSGNPILAGYLNTMEVGIDLAGTTAKLVRKVKVERRDKLNFFATTEFYNPMKVPILLYYVSFSPVFRGQKLSPLVIDKRDNPDIVPPEKVSMSAPVPVPIRLGTALLGGMIFLKDHVLHLGSENIEAMGSVQVGIEDYRVTLSMHVKNLNVDG